MWDIALMNLGQAEIHRPPAIQVIDRPKKNPYERSEAQKKAMQIASRIANAKKKERTERDKRDMMAYIKAHGEVTLRTIALRFSFSETKTANLITDLSKEGRLAKHWVGRQVLWKTL